MSCIQPIRFRSRQGLPPGPAGAGRPSDFRSWKCLRWKAAGPVKKTAEKGETCSRSTAHTLCVCVIWSSAADRTRHACSIYSGMCNSNTCREGVWEEPEEKALPHQESLHEVTVLPTKTKSYSSCSAAKHTELAVRGNACPHDVTVLNVSLHSPPPGHSRWRPSLSLLLPEVPSC